MDSARVFGSAPSYLHCLSMIGQFLNQQRARQVTVTEVDNGFLILYFPNGNMQRQHVLSLEYTDLLELSGGFAEAAKGRKHGLLRGGDTVDKKHPLLPQGYATVLRTIGYKLDRRHASSLTVCETNDKLYIFYWLNKATFVIVDQRRQAITAQQEEVYNAKDLARYVRETQEAESLEVKRYRGGLRVNPYDHLSSLRAALMYEDSGAYGDAESLLTQIVKQVPEHPEAHYHVARLALARGDKNAALSAARKAVSLHEDLAATHDLLGRALRLHGKHADAVAALEQAEAIEPHNRIIHQHLALAYAAVGRAEDAAQQLALVSSQTAAPAWETVQEHESGEPLPELIEPISAASPSLDAGPSEAALLPTLADKDQAGELPQPVLTTFDSAASPAWGQAQPAQVEAESAQAWTPQPQTPSVPLSAFPAEAPVGSWPPPAPSQPQAIPTGSWPPAPQAPYPAQPPAAGANAPQAGYIQAGWNGAPPVQQQAYAPAEWTAGWPAQTQGTASPGAPGQMAQTAMPRQAPQATMPAAAPTTGSWPPDNEQPASLPGLQPQAAAPMTQQPAWSQPLTASFAQQPAALQTPSGMPHPTTVETVSPETTGTHSAAGEQPAEELSTVQLAAEVMLTKRAIEAEPNRAELHRKLGFLLARQGKPSEAAAEFRKALECSRTSL